MSEHEGEGGTGPRVDPWALRSWDGGSGNGELWEGWEQRIEPVESGWNPPFSLQEEWKPGPREETPQGDSGRRQPVGNCADRITLTITQGTEEGLLKEPPKRPLCGIIQINVKRAK